MGDSDWGVYLWVQLSDAGEVEEPSGGIDTSGGGAYNVHPWNSYWNVCVCVCVCGGGGGGGGGGGEELNCIS